jgi:hypothetical protein
MDNPPMFLKTDAILTPRLIVWVELLHFTDRGATVDELVAYIRSRGHVVRAGHDVATITDVVGRLLEELINAKVGGRYAVRLADGRYRAMPGYKETVDGPGDVLA